MVFKFFAKRIGNPNRLHQMITKHQSWLLCLSVVLLMIGALWALVYAPTDIQHGESVRIMYIHVPSAWLTMLCYGIAASFAIGGLAGKLPVYHLLSRGFCVAGSIFCMICLLTGALWGYEAWGTFWAWDARLTSVLLLFFIYIGYLFYTSDRMQNPDIMRIGAWILIIGFINLPIIKFSVDIWTTLHQPASITRLDKPAMPASMLLPILMNFIAFLCAAITISLLASKRYIRQLLQLAQRKEQQVHIQRQSQAKAKMKAKANAKAKEKTREKQKT
jgi:heme exporter protein C